MGGPRLFTAVANERGCCVVVDKMLVDVKEDTIVDVLVARVVVLVSNDERVVFATW